jgi:hypothetical protein
MRPIVALAASSAAALVAVACASAPPQTQPRAIVLEQIRARPQSQAAFVDSYDEALASIAAITERDLGLPKLAGVLHLLPDRQALYDVLQANGADSVTAGAAADRMIAVGAYRAVYVNQERFARLNWNARLAVLAHEVAHAGQYELSGGRRGTSDQWLREGFADWVQAHVLDALGVLTREGILTRNSRFISTPGRREQLPPLSDMANFPQWVELSTSGASDLLYPYAYVATDFLIQRHNQDDVITYFRLFAASDDRLANFKQAFGEEWSAFDAALREHVAQLRPY